MKKIAAIILCLLVFCSCNSIEGKLPFLSSSSNLTVTSQDTNNTSTSSKPVNFTTTIYAAKNTTTYNSNLIYPKTIYTSIKKEEYFYYSQLPDNFKKLYNRLCENIEGMADGFIDLGYLKDSEISQLVSSVKYDHPEYFWIGHDYVTNTKKDGFKQIAFKFKSKDYSINYLYSPENRNKILASIKKTLSYLETKVQNKTKFERELYIHDYVTGLCTYNKSAQNNSETQPEAYSIYGALVLRSAVCEGYSKAIQLINNHFGINTTVIIGSSDNQNHMWNLVKIENQYYHLDATFNDSSDTQMYSFFNLTDTAISRTHKIDNTFYNKSPQKIKLPIADRLEHSYFSVYDSFIRENPQTDIYNIISAAIHDGKTAVHIGYADNFTTFYKNNDEFLANDIDIMYIMHHATKNYRAKIKDVKLTFASNYNFRITWRFE